MIGAVSRKRAYRKGAAALELAFANASVSQLFDRELERLGLRPAQVGVLALVQINGPITPTELELESGLPSTTLRERLQGLADAGYIARTTNAADRRSYFLDTTAEGDAFLAATIPAMVAVEEKLARLLGTPFEEYREPLHRLRKAAQALLAEDAGLSRG